MHLSRSYRAPLLIVGSVLLIVLSTLYPFSFQNPEYIRHFSQYFEGLERRGLLGLLETTFLTPLGSSTPIKSAFERLANVLLFAPLGYGLTRLAQGRRLHGCLTLVLVPVVCAGLSFTVEILQVSMPSRTSTFTDVVTNTLGGCTGVLAAVLRGFWQQRITLPTSGRAWARMLAGYAACVLLFSGIFALETHLWSLKNWNANFPLVVGNESTGERPWHGRVSHILITDRVFSPDEAAAFLSGEPSSVNKTLLGSYAFESRGPYRDHAGHLPPLTWKPSAPGPRADRGVQLTDRHWLETGSSIAHANERIREKNQFTIGMIFTSSEGDQDGPARILSVSRGINVRNVMLGQRQNDLVLRVRTPFTGENGSTLEFVVPDVISDTRQHRVVVTYDPSGIKFYIDEENNAYTVALTPATKAAWFLAHTAVGRLDIQVERATAARYRLLYYGLILVPPIVGGAVVAAAAGIRRRRRSRA